MDRGEREARVRMLLDGMARRPLYKLARRVEAAAYAGIHKEDLLDLLADVSPAALCNGLAGGVSAPDLRQLCARLGYSTAGSSLQLASRLCEAVERTDGRVTRWRQFEDARSFARRLQLNSQAEWYAFARGRMPAKGELPDDIPRKPDAAYADCWTMWGDFLGTGNPSRRDVPYRPFAEARAYVRALGLENAAAWKEFVTRRVGNQRVCPPDIPSMPSRVYAKTGWVSFGDWLGTGRVHGSRVVYRSYRTASAFVRALGITTEPEWRAYCRGEIHQQTPRPLEIPTNPNRSYRGRGWVSWGRFFGTNSVALYDRTFRPFASARAYIRKLRLADTKAWRAWCAAGKRPADIPGAPETYYADDGWTSWGDFLGNGNVHRGLVEYRSLSETQALARALDVRSRAEFTRACRDGRLPHDVRVTVDRMAGWRGWSSFLGTRRQRLRRSRDSRRLNGRGPD